MIGGVLYVSTSASQVAAIDAISGRTLWSTTRRSGFTARRPILASCIVASPTGPTAATRDPDRHGNAYLVALDARTGVPIASFGVEGRVDLTRARAPGRSQVVHGDVAATGHRRSGDRRLVDRGPALASDMPPGHVRAFDVRTGTQQWIFHSIPQSDQFGIETWAGESWRTVGGVNVWTIMSADEELGYVYLPSARRRTITMAASDTATTCSPTASSVSRRLPGGGYGTSAGAPRNLGLRHPCSSEPGRHHDRRRRVRAVAQVTKQGFVYVFDRATGKPLWPIEDRPVPQSTVPGEQTARGSRSRRSRRRSSARKRARLT